MKVVLIGNSTSGQQHLFSLLTGINLSDLLQKPLEIHKGICDVIDPRVLKLKKMYNPHKTTFAKIEYLLLPDFSIQGQKKSSILNELKNCDEICFVTRAENAKDEIDSFISELVLNDFILVEKRIETIEKEQKKKFIPEKEKEKNLLFSCKKYLEEGKLLRDMSVGSDDEKLLNVYQFLTKKPLIIVVNSSTSKPDNDEVLKNIRQKYGILSIGLNIELEEEIRSIPVEEREEFIKELGIDEPALNKMTRMVFSALGLISFFTVGEDEVRAWAIKSGSTAPVAGRAIHSDIEKGFVRVEMFKYEDLILLGSEGKLKEQGKFYLKGKDYIVEDGDILSFRFNV